MSSAQVETSFSLFDSANHVLDQADLIELVSGATLRNSPPSRMVTSSPILTTGTQSLTRPSSPSLESAFNILGDQDHVVSQITLINGEKIWVREEKSPSWASSSSQSTVSSDGDCNSSTDSIPLFVSTSNQVSELDLSTEMMDLTTLLGSSEPVLKPLVTKDTKANNNQELPKPGNSLLRSALTGKTSYLMTKQKQQATFRPGSESSKIGEQKVEEILLLAKKRTLENSNVSIPQYPVTTSSTTNIQFSDKLVINTANLLNTAATQLNLAPPSLSSLVPIKNSSSGDTNNNIKSIPPPASVISLVVDVGNNNSVTTNANLNLPSLLEQDSSLEGSPSKKRILKRQKSTSSTPMISSAAAFISPQTSTTSNQENSQEPRKEARLLHYCPICNKGFKDRYSVNVHVRTHTGEKPFSCALCGKCFRQKAHLAKHHQTHAAKQNSSSGILPKNTPEKPPNTTDQSSNSSTEKIVFPMSPVSVEISS